LWTPATSVRIPKITMVAIEEANRVMATTLGVRWRTFNCVALFLKQ
jgi:hypothetical protein